MELSYFKNKKITVFGLGLHGGGVGTVKFLVSQGAKVIVTDISSKEKLAPSLKKLKDLKNVTYILGQHRREDFINVDMVIKNPAISWDDKNIKLAQEKKVPVEMDSSLFFKLCKNPIIGVTATKGKTTITTLIYEILKSADKKPVKVGISQVSVLDKLLSLKKDSVVVFELSSWRLSALGHAKLSPHIAVFGNLMRDHLNYYGTMEKYLADKKNIFNYQNSKDWLVLNGDQAGFEEFENETKSQVIKFSHEPLEKNCSVFIKESSIYLNNEIDIKKIISIENIKIPGKHNLSNIMAAIGAAHAYGLDVAEIKKAVPLLRGVEHRLEFVRELNEVRFYNDTAATIPDAVISALGAFKDQIVLIAGGTDKNLNFKEFAKEIIEKTKNIILLKGTATDKILIELAKIVDENFLANIEIVDSMEKAVLVAQKKAESGDIVLLSPGAASFGLFANEFDRGDKFRDAVKKLK